jgi:hypothetical protein
VTQFSLFGAAASDPTVDDLDGILLAGGHWVRHGDAARLSVVVADRWRADALAAEFARLGFAAEEAVVASYEGFGARTAFAAELSSAAARWSHGTGQQVPADFALGPGGLRLWAIAAGRRDPAGYLLGTARPDDAVHLRCGAQLSRLGLAAVSISGRGGPGWRVTSTRRIRRLGELLGPPPPGAEADWPLGMA